MNINFSLLTR